MIAIKNTTTIVTKKPCSIKNKAYYILKGCLSLLSQFDNIKRCTSFEPFNLLLVIRVIHRK